MRCLLNLRGIKMKIKPFLRKAIEEDSLAVIRVLLESWFWPKSLGTMEPYERFEDDSPRGQISVLFTQDGDGWIQVISKPDPNEMNSMFRFRMPMIGGGESPRTRVALLILAEAIRLDNEKNPQHRGK